MPCSMVYSGLYPSSVLAFTMSADLLCIAGFDGFFKQLNPAWEKTLGFTREQLQAMSVVLDYTPHAAQMEIHRGRDKRFRTVCAGRRFGKTLCLAAESTRFVTAAWGCAPSHCLV